MMRSRPENRRLVQATTLFLASVGVFAWAVSALVTSDEVRGLLWPNDINLWLATLLGGTAEVNAAGVRTPSVTLLPVFLRVFSISGVAIAAAWFRCRRLGQPQRNLRIANALMTSSYALLIGSAWWLVWLVGSIGAAGVLQFAAGVLPLWLMLSIAFTVWAWLDALLFVPTGKPDVAQLSGSTAFSLMVMFAAAWAAVSFWMNYRLYENLLIPHGDSAMYEEHLWNVWHGKGFRSYLDQGLFLGEHIQVIHLLLLPLHRLWPSHLLLEMAESVALASCSIPIYCIAKRHSKNATAAAMLGVAWLFFFPMHFLDIAIDQKTFRPIVLGLPFLFWLIDLVGRRRFVLAALCLVLALSAKEDMALITFPLMLVMGMLAFRRRHKIVESGEEQSGEPRRPLETDRKAEWWCFGMAAFSVLYLLAAVLVVIPAFRAGAAVHYSRYFGDLGRSPRELLQTTITHPAKVLAQIFSLRTLLYAVTFLGPLAFLPLRRVFLLAAGVLTVVMLSLIQLGDGSLPPIPYHHFHAPLLPVLFWAAAVALSRVRNGSAASAALLVLLCCLFTSLPASTTPLGLTFWSTESPFSRTALYTLSDRAMLERAAMADRVVEQIPPTARVASTDYIHTRLTHCERSYDYSGYVRAVNNYQKGVPPDTDYIVIDTGHRYSEIRRPEDVPELQADDPEWRLMPDTTNGHFLVLERRR